MKTVENIPLILCLCINSAASLRFHYESCLEKSSIKTAFC